MEHIRICFNINGVFRTLTVDPGERALDVLREDLHLTGTKEGCGVGECGACTILMNSMAVNACMVPALQLDHAEVLTVEGLENLPLGRALQQAYAENGAVQCGFCTPGMLVSSYALLIKNPDPSDGEIRRALAGNLCRCTGYTPIINAVKDAALLLRKTR